MTYLLVRNRVSEYSRWKAVFDSQADRALAAGLRLAHLWQVVDEPDTVFFMLEVEDIARARSFMDHPESAKAGEDSGVVDGEFHFVESAPG